jgi:hypothetical protein
MFLLFLFALIPAFLLSCFSPVDAQFYKYIDKDGVVRFTDDPARVPEDLRERATEYIGSSPPSQAPDASGPLPAGDTPGGEKPESASSENDSKKDELTARRAALKSEHDALIKEKERIEKETEIFSKRLKTRKRKEVSRSKLEELSVQKMNWNKRYQEYEEKKKAMERAAAPDKRDR